MKERKEVLDYGLTFPDVYLDSPFHDDNWILLRCRKNNRAFAWTYERNGHWNSIILDGTIPDEEIKRMIAESYDLVISK